MLGLAAQGAPARVLTRPRDRGFTRGEWALVVAVRCRLRVIGHSLSRHAGTDRNDCPTARGCGESPAVRCPPRVNGQLLLRSGPTPIEWALVVTTRRDGSRRLPNGARIRPTTGWRPLLNADLADLGGCHGGADDAPFTCERGERDVIAGETHQNELALSGVGVGPCDRDGIQGSVR